MRNRKHTAESLSENDANLERAVKRSRKHTERTQQRVSRHSSSLYLHPFLWGERLKCNAPPDTIMFISEANFSSRADGIDVRVYSTQRGDRSSSPLRNLRVSASKVMRISLKLRRSSKAALYRRLVVSLSLPLSHELFIVAWVSMSSKRETDDAYLGDGQLIISGRTRVSAVGRAQAQPYFFVIWSMQRGGKWHSRRRGVGRR